MDFVKLKGKLTMAIVAMSLYIGSASADIASDMENFTTIVTNFSQMMTAVLNIFLQPPLLYFTVLVIFVAIIGIAKRLMHAGGKR